MPTMTAPTNSPTLSEKPSVPPAPPQTLSSSQPPKNRESAFAAILFIISLLLLCGLIGTFIVKSTRTYQLETPTLTEIPALTNKSSIVISGFGPKKATIEVSTEANSYSTTSDKNGSFSLTVQTGEDGKRTFYAIARKKILFFKFESARSNEITTTIDKTAPNIKIVTLPKTLTNSRYILKGSSSEPAKVTISVNGKDYLINTDKDNTFKQQITLKEGTNTLLVKAKDYAENETVTATMSTNYATGSVYVSGKGGTKNLPDSSGELSSALSTVFGRIVALTALVIGTLGFFASSGFVTLAKIAKQQ